MKKWKYITLICLAVIALVGAFMFINNQMFKSQFERMINIENNKLIGISSNVLTDILIATFINPSPTQGSFITNTNYTLNVSTTSNQSTKTYSFFADGLVGWWRMDNDSSVGENATLIYDWSGMGNNAVCSTGSCPISSSSSGKFVGAEVFNHTNGIYYTIPASNSLNLTTFTISMWINESSACTVYDGILQWGLDFRISCGSSAFILNSASLGSWPDLLASNALDKYGNLVIVSNGTGYSAYWNTNNTFNISDPTFVGTGKDDIYIGNGLFAFNAPFVGYIDELMIFNRTLSATEIQALYNSSQYYLQRSLTYTNGLQNYTAFAVDSGGNLNSTTLTFNSNVTSSSPCWTKTNNILAIPTGCVYNATGVNSIP